jgi:signal transduction histidine kinase
VCDIDGTVLNCSDNEVNPSYLGKMVPAQTIMTINGQGKYSGITSLGGVYSSLHYVVGVPITAPRSPGSLLGYVFLSGQTVYMAEIWRQFAWIFMFAALFVLVIASIIIFSTTKRQARPIREMAEAAGKFGRGDFSVRVSSGGRSDEIGALADSFNAMADSLERSEKARSDLIANVSHELKTPMTTISGFADGILDGTIPPERQREYMAIISSETKRLSRLVRGMLEVSRVHDTPTDSVLGGTFNLNEVAAQALISLEGRITARGLDVDASLPEDEIMARGDGDAITQVIYNLLDNAAKFAYEGTTSGLKLWKQEGRAYVQVENTGDTIPREELPLIFDRFHKTDRSRSEDREGVGLGLYIVKTILDNHDQDIFVTSEEGVTKFVFTLALAQ